MTQSISRPNGDSIKPAAHSKAGEEHERCFAVAARAAGTGRAAGGPSAPPGRTPGSSPNATSRRIQSRHAGRAGTKPYCMSEEKELRAGAGVGSASSRLRLAALVVADVLACLRAGTNAVFTIFGKAPERCQKACRLIINRQTRSTCGNPCCLAEDHGPVWNHSCHEHVQMGGRVSSFEYKTYMLFR